jgi:hypothetical protein
MNFDLVISLINGLMAAYMALNKKPPLIKIDAFRVSA